MSMTDFTPYSTAKSLIRGFPAWVVDEQERTRVAAYQLYEEMYWGTPNAYKLLQRGSDTNPIYIPAARQIVDTLHRYTAPGMRVVPQPRLTLSAAGGANPTATDEQLALAGQAWADFSRRERFPSKFSANKRYGIMRGDWVFYLRADPARPEGTRVSIEMVDPGGLFAIYEDGNPDSIIGWHIVDQFINERGDVLIKRTTFRKTTGTGGPSPITMEVSLFESDEWGGPGMAVEDEKPVNDPGFESVPEITLPGPIDSLPVYIIRNFEEPQNPWGSSELRGMERLLSAINQSISDEELELVLNGLGVYATNSGTPIDADTGEEVGWDLGPARVVQVPGGKDAFFNRVSGVGSVTPHQDHLKYLHDQLDAGAGIPAVAKGRVDVAVAESGIALYLQMGPIIFRAEEKETLITDTLTQMFFDWAKFMTAYEGSQYAFMFELCSLVPMYGSKIPANRAERFKELMEMATGGLIPWNVFWDEIRKIGYEDIPDNESLLRGLLEQKTATSQIDTDVTDSRMDEELDDEGDEAI